jgi:hypothetical protein
MTFRRDLKKRIRRRQAETGERYTTARAQVLGKTNLMVELHEVPSHPGVLCPVRATSPVRPHAPQLLDQLRQILLGPVEGLEPMRRAVLHGEQLPFGRGSLATLVMRLRQFRIGLEQGLRGPGPGGRIVAFDATLDGEVHAVIAQLFPRHDSQPMLLLSLPGDVETGTLFDSFWWVHL